MLDNERWFIKNRKGDPDELTRKLGVSDQLARMLVAKSICDPKIAEGFLSPALSSLHPAAMLMDMDKALAVLEDAAVSDEPALVIGDYDVDGVVGAFVLCDVLARRFSNVMHYIPHRVDDGYGINERIVRFAHDAGVKLIVTCDNGISAREPLTLARSLGMRVVLTDHHEVPDGPLPEADAVINPKRQDCSYPFKDLCGAAVAYKLAIAFADRMGVELDEEVRDSYLCFIAIATICDIVDLVDENRAIVAFGLRCLNEGISNAGLRELVSVCGLAGRELTAYNIGHVIGPCLNATGRLDSAELSYQLFAEADMGKARALAQTAYDLNKRRQAITHAAVADACELISREGLSQDKTIVVHVPGMHESVAGIVAGKLKDRYARPAIVFADGLDGRLKGSGRSIEGYNMLDAVVCVGDMLEKYGGHAMAIGISIKQERLGEFRAALLDSCALSDEDLVPKELIDLCLRSVDIGPGLISDLARLEPCGRGNPRPQFASRALSLDYAALIGIRKNVIKIKLGARDRLIDAVYFGDTAVFMRVLGMAADEMGILTRGGADSMAVDVIFYPEINEFSGVRRIQLVIKSIRPANGSH